MSRRRQEWRVGCEQESAASCLQWIAPLAPRRAGQFTTGSLPLGRWRRTLKPSPKCLPQNATWERCTGLAGLRASTNGARRPAAAAIRPVSSGVGASPRPTVPSLLWIALLRRAILLTLAVSVSVLMRGRPPAPAAAATISASAPTDTRPHTIRRYHRPRANLRCARARLSMFAPHLTEHEASSHGGQHGRDSSSLHLEGELVVRLLVAVLAGGMIGLERRTAARPAGVRTLALVSMGAATFTIVSIFGFAGSDTSRVAAQVASGVGFIGAGVIGSGASGRAAMGLSTASAIWVAAALGVASGAGLYFVAMFGSILTVMILRGGKRAAPPDAGAPTDAHAPRMMREHASTTTGHLQTREPMEYPYDPDED
ncbi:hypothetical protein CDCA_CDCA06G1757 [Cyanidium caldarium]|uniref:MgtC/SapB/SrpB/YhiD N-terminal domain-containing protein n=1 Tax=Cyanidium caldarium TaxID=2771 RepID=A0AAV9ITZ2_CYACA|nr:hypothetical protein CDCA_CDCA06G1757 [Cyanidium caldarium]